MVKIQDKNREYLADDLVSIADDMKNGDNSLNNLIDLNQNYDRMFKHPYITDPNYNDINVLITQWKDLNAQACLTKPTLENVANLMVDKVINGAEGQSYSFPLLNEEAKNCSSTDNLINRIKTSLEFELKKDADFIHKKGLLRLVTNNQYNSERSAGEDGVILQPNTGNLEITRDDIPSPIYGSDCSYCMAIMVNDTWAQDVKISKASVNSNRTYSVTLEFVIYDHYGLNDKDIVPPKPFSDDFRFLSWFALQRWDKFRKKPFITEIKFTKTINGTF